MWRSLRAGGMKGEVRMVGAEGGAGERSGVSRSFGRL